MNKRCLINLLVVVASVALAACDSSTRMRAAGGTTTTVATSSVPPAGIVGTSEPTTGPTIPSAPTTTTTAPAPMPVDGAGVSGRVTAGPTCPVERPDHPCPPNPVRGRVDAIDPGGRTAGSATTDGAGHYMIGLPIGDYTLRIVTDGPFPRCPDSPVTVTAGSVVAADIECDTGIR